MPLTLNVKSIDGTEKRQREAVAHRVVDCLGFCLPNRQLLCFLDDEDWWALKEESGIDNRGFYSPVTADDPVWRNAPGYILEHVFVNRIPAFHDFIYLHGSSCSSDLGLTMTLAHELQHCLQHDEQTPLWAANTLIPNLCRATGNPPGLRWCDIPLEREARIVSKRTAEQLFGADRVRVHIDAMIAKRVTVGDAADWECIRGLATSIPYDLARETKLFFQSLKDYRSELEDVLRDLQSGDPDFADLDLDRLIMGEALQ